MLNFFVDNEKLKKLCVSTFESALAELFFLLAFCHIESSALWHSIFSIKKLKNSIPPNFFSKSPLKKLKTRTSLSRSHGYNDPFFLLKRWNFSKFFDLKIFQYGESLTTHKISLAAIKYRPLFCLYLVPVVLQVGTVQ